MAAPLTLWSTALRRVVRDEEEREREKRVATQLRLKREAARAAAAAAAAAASTASTGSAVASGDTAIGEAVTTDASGASLQSNGNGSAGGDVENDTNTRDSKLNEEEAKSAAGDDENEEEEEEEDYIQRHLLSLPKSKWTCLEDSQQAFSLAMNRQKSVFAVGEREGRLSIWDNVSIRVITRELDPTLVSIPEAPDVAGATAASNSVSDVSPSGQKAAAVLVTGRGTNRANDQSTNDDNHVAGDASGDATPEDGDEDSATNDDRSVEVDDMDDMDDLDDDEDDDEEEDTASAEDGDGNTEEDDDDDGEDMDEDEDDENDKKTNSAAPTSASSQPRTDAASATSATGANGLARQSQPTAGSASTGLSREELEIVKTSLKVVTCCAWSCDTRWLFAGCEEKGNRRGRLCVWDVQAASIFATFSFDAAINCVSAHPGDPDLVLVSYYNALPVLLNVRTRTSTQLDVPLTNPTINTTVPANSRHPSLVVAAKFGTSGAWIYCVTSKSTAAIFDSATLACLHSTTLTVLIQFIDVSIDYRETALILTSAKGIHEFAIVQPPDGANTRERSLREVRAYATGAVRAPWAICCFSDDESFVVGMPVVRHRHVGESGLYTWNRTTGKVQHNAGVKDGVNALVWDTRRDSILAVSTTGALFVFEEEFKTTWSGPMYPAGYRLITDNELHAAAMDAELAALEQAKRNAGAADKVIDVFTIAEPAIGPSTAQRAPFAHLATRLEPSVANELVSIPAVPIAHHHKKHHHAFQGHAYNEEKHFGLGQSIFEPLKVPAKAKSARSKKKTSSDAKTPGADGSTAKVAAKKKRTKSSIGSQKRRRR